MRLVCWGLYTEMSEGIIGKQITDYSGQLNSFGLSLEQHSSTIVLLLQCQASRIATDGVLVSLLCTLRTTSAMSTPRQAV